MRLFIDVGDTKGRVTARVARRSGEIEGTLGTYTGMSRAAAAQRVRDVVETMLADWVSKRAARQLAPIPPPTRKKA